MRAVLVAFLIATAALLAGGCINAGTNPYGGETWWECNNGCWAYVYGPDEQMICSVKIPASHPPRDDELQILTCNQEKEAN